MGTGKSSVGRVVADILHFTFLDTDHVIEARAGKARLPEAVGQRTCGDRQLGDVAGRQSRPRAAPERSRAGHRRRHKGHRWPGGQLARLGLKAQTWIVRSSLEPTTGWGVSVFSAYKVRIL